MIIKYNEGKAQSVTLDKETWRAIDPQKISEITIEEKDNEILAIETLLPIIDSQTKLWFLGKKVLPLKDYYIHGTNITLYKKMQLEKIKDRTKELGDTEIAKKYAELEADFEYIKALNTDLAEKYEAVIGVFPTSEEILFLINTKKEFQNIEGQYTQEEQKVVQERIAKLTAFKNMVEMLEQQDVYKKPKKYEELESEN